MLEQQSEHLSQRRQELLARSAIQRETMVTAAHSLSGPMATVDKVTGVIHRITQHPVWLAGLGLGAIALLRPRRRAAASPQRAATLPLRLAGLVQGTLVALRTWRTVAPVVQGLLTRRRQLAVAQTGRVDTLRH
jgi:hypothetical protein